MVVAVADGPYAGYFRYSGSSVGDVRLGWKGSTSCTSNRNHCSADAYSSDTCFVDAMLAVAAFVIIGIVLGFFVMLPIFLTMVGVGPAVLHISNITVVLSAFTGVCAMLAWAISLGRVLDCSTVSWQIDYNPPLLIVATLAWLGLAIAMSQRRSSSYMHL